MTQWTLDIPEDLDRDVRKFLDSHRELGDISEFVRDAVARELFRRTLGDVRRQHEDMTEDEAMVLANEAVAWARADRS